MLTLPASVRVFVARGATELRRSFESADEMLTALLGDGKDLIPLRFADSPEIAPDHGCKSEL